MSLQVDSLIGLIGVGGAQHSVLFWAASRPEANARAAATLDLHFKDIFSVMYSLKDDSVVLEEMCCAGGGWVWGTGWLEHWPHLGILSGFCRGYGKYRRTKRPPSSKAPASSSSGSSSVPYSVSAPRGAVGKLGMMAPPKPRNRQFLQPSYSVL